MSENHLLKVFVPLIFSGVKSWIFNLMCPGNTKSLLYESLLLLKNATVKRSLSFDDVCVEKHVSVAYNNEPEAFEFNSITGEMVRYPVAPFVKYPSTVAWEWEIQASFFESNNIKPQWFNANYTWGSLDQVTGQWSGAVGLIQRNVVDYAIWGFSGTYARSKVAAFSSGIDYQPKHWLTRYPRELSPTWNLLGLFTKECNSQMSK